jgi:hypothetical protein
MNNKNFAGLIFCLAFLIFGCSKDDSESPETILSGVSFYALPEECDFEGRGAEYALKMTGELEGCLYAFIDTFSCYGDGFYLERGRELFVGTYNGEPGTFETTYDFEGLYEGCAENGSYEGAEIIGLCQHPIVAGSGTGVFEGATGRLDFIDDAKAQAFYYRGNLQY